MPSLISVATKEVSELTYDATADLSAALLQGQCGFNIVLRTIVRENLFSKVKFIHKDEDLIFDQDPKTICSSMLKCLNVEHKPNEFKLRVWTANVSNIDKYLAQHRNNTIKKFKRMAKSK